MSQLSDQVVGSAQPLLTLAIPTFNRATYLQELLECLLLQFADVPDGHTELIVSDNCSEDNTPEIVEQMQARGLRCRYIRRTENIGSDNNFLQCLSEARGKYVWVMGDDDLLVPHAIPDLMSLLRQGEFDLVYLSSFAFTNAMPVPLPVDRFGRFAEVTTDGAYFLEKVNALIGLISVNIVNKNRLLAVPHPPLESLRDSNLIQVGWLFPLIHRKASVLYVWQRLVAYRSYNSGGWGIAEVFGVRLERIARSYFANEPELTAALMNGVLRYWLFDAIIGMRSGLHAEMNAEDFARDIRHVFHGNWRYWIFVWPVAQLPLPLAKAYHRVFQVVNKFARAYQAIWRHLFGAGQYLKPAA